MRFPFAFFVGLRYTRAKRRNHFISFMSFTSMAGIALGVMVLITVLSVMNGFDDEVKNRIFGMARQITISNFVGNLTQWPSIQRALKNNPEVLESAPFILQQGLLTNRGQVSPVAIFGVDPKQEAKVSILTQKIVEGNFNRLTPGSFGVALGQKLADNLGLSLGDKVNVVTPTVNFTPAGLMPRFKRFTIVAIFKVGNGFDFDSSLAYINLHDAQVFFQMDDSVSGVRLKIKNLYNAPALSAQISHELGDNYLISNWTREFGPFFSAIKMEKSMMFLVLLLIIAIAAFNLVSSLVMVVNDKRADIAILRTLGASRKTILRIFIIQGSLIGFSGTLIGVVGGIILAHNVTGVVNFIQDVFHVQLISQGVYYLDFLPSKIDWFDVLKICIAALGMSFLATIYPAWNASRTEPAAALRYE